MVYEVDKDTYKEFCQAMGWKDPSPFGRCVSTLGGSGQPQSQAILDARNAIKRKQERRYSPGNKRRQERKDPPSKKCWTRGEGPLRINVLQLTAPKRSRGSSVRTQTLPRTVTVSSEAQQEPQIEVSPERETVEMAPEEEVVAQSLHAPLVTSSGASQPTQAGNSRVGDWKREFLSGAAELRAQIAVWRFQIEQAEKRVELWERLGSS